MWTILSERSGISVELLQRLAVTLVAVGVVVAGTFLPVPFAEIPRAEFYGLPRHPLTIGVLGIAPFAVGYVLVEGVALLVGDSDADFALDAQRPAWIPRAAAIAGLVLAGLYGLETAAYWFSMAPAGLSGPGSVSDAGALRWMGTAVSIAAGSGLYYLTARWVSRAGLGDGFSVVLGTGIAWEIVPASHEFTDWLRGMSFENLDVFAILGNILAVAVVVLAVLWTVTRFEEWVTRPADGGSESDGDRTLRPDSAAATPFHVPAAGVLPFAIGTLALWMVWFGRTIYGNESLRWLQEGIGTVPHAATVPFFLQELGAVLVVGALLAWLLVRRDTERAVADAETVARWRRRAILASLGFVALLVVVDVFGGPLVRSLGVVNIVLGTAVAYDVVREWRFRGAFGEVVPVRRLHRTGAVGSHLERLADEGVPAFVRGRAFRGMLRFFGPFTPHVVFVPESCRESAVSALGEDRSGSDGDD